MKLLIIGATRGTGKMLVEQALAEGHEVRALVRDASRIEVDHPSLEVMVGDALDAAQMARAVEGCDAVLSTVGAPALKPTTLRADAAQVAIEAMKARGVERYIALSSMGVGESHDNLPFFLRRIIIPFYLRRAFEDHARQEALIAESGLSWTVVKPPTLTDGDKTGKFEHAESLTHRGDLAFKVSRADVASFMLGQVSSDTYVGRTAALSY